METQIGNGKEEPAGKLRRGSMKRNHPRRKGRAGVEKEDPAGEAKQKNLFRKKKRENPLETK